MLAELRTWLQRLRYSYLFLPGLLSLAFAAGAFGLLWIDSSGGRTGAVGVFPAGPPAARTVLSVVAGSLITVAGVTFSITIVTLQLVSQQFTPRALRTFLGDRLNQSVAGVFIGVFLYCLIVLTAVDERPEPFVPGLSVAVAFVFAVVALGMLLVFIHHMAQAIQVSSIASRIAHLTLKAVNDRDPSDDGCGLDDDPERVAAAWRAESDPVLVFPDRAGFVQSVDQVPTNIGGRSFKIEVLAAPGDFVTERHPLAAAWPAGKAAACARALQRAIAVESERDLRQDVGYGIRQLTDIAVRALSPSVNDPTTATTCVGYLKAILERLALAPRPRAVRRFEEQDVTIVMRTRDPAWYLESLVQIARYADDARVVDALLRATQHVAETAADGADGAAWADAARTTGDRIAARALEQAPLDEQERASIERLRAQLLAAR